MQASKETCIFQDNKDVCLFLDELEGGAVF